MLHKETEQLLQAYKRQVVWAVIGKFFVMLPLFLAALVVRGFCLSVLWGWLIVPVFHVPALTIAAALGLSVFLCYLLRHQKEAGGFWTILGEGVVALGVGYLIHLFI